jgi:Fe-S-cluster containining protein
MQQFFERSYAAVKSVISAAKSAEELKAVTAHALVELDDIFAQRMIRLRASIACCAGCCYCCYLKVDVLPAEAFLLADYVLNNCTEDEKSVVLMRAEANRVKISPLSCDQHMGANLPCPLLKDERCLAYSARPSLCRMFHAQTVQTCKESFEQPEDLDSPDSQVTEIRVVLMVAREALAKAYKDCGYDARPYDLNSSLLEALRDTNSEKRWRDKKAAFPRTALAKDYVERRGGHPVGVRRRG